MNPAIKRFLCSLVALSIFYAQTSFANIPNQILNWSNDHVYKIQAPWSFGSGFFVSDTLLVTACHVVEGQEVVRAYNHKDFTILTVISCNKKTDLAVLKRVKPITTGFKVEINSEIPKQGLKLYGAGYPLALPMIISTGHAQNKYEDFYFSTTPTSSGDSGSPVLSLVDGIVKVEGVRLAVMINNRKFVSHLTLVRPGAAIIKILDKVNVNR